MKMIDVDGARIAYEDSGRNHGPAVLLLNALGTDWGLWDEQRPALERAFRVLRFDVRGHGKSVLTDPSAMPSWSIDTLMADACAVLDAAGVERANWCGVSLGGMIAMRAAIKRPQRVARLVLANTAAQLGTPDSWQARIDSVLQSGMGATADVMAARWFTPDFIARHPERVEKIIAMVRATQPRAYAACCVAIRDMDQRETLGFALAPTLVIVGARDAGATIEHAELLSSRIPGADLLVLDASHMSCVEQAEDFSAALLDFLRH
jgi:3-oxoadipate enol-lactonase